MEDKHKSAQNENKFSALITLIKRESIEEIKEVLHKWFNLLNLKDQGGRTALHHCSEHSSALCADLILDSCPSLLTAQDNDGYTALHLSVICGNQVIARYLIGKSDTNSVNQCDNESHTAIHWATVCGQLECLDLLLNSGAHSSRADIHGAYPLHYSAQMCNPHSGICIGDDPRVGLAVLNRLLRGPDVDVDCVDSDGRTPLLWAASAGSADSLLALINAGANVAAKDKDGLTALHCASSRGHIDCVETLLTLCGSDVNQMDSNGCPPLFYAVTLGHADCTRLLIESGADVNAQDFKGRTAAHCGAARGQFETIKILGQQGANLWLRNSRGDLPLHEAIKSGRKELVKWLLDQIPAAVNATNSFGRSALHIAAINNNIEMCKILIDIGADVNTVMKTKGHFITPLDAALQKGYRGVAKYLLLHGALPASRISHSLNKSSVQRCPSGRPIDSFTAFDNNSPIESYDEWKARAQSTDSVLNSQSIQSQINPMESSRTQLPKLPTLVKNSTDEQHLQETSSSTPSSLLENTNHYKSVREFETPLNDKPSNLKQAIITNVYVTNTPICHSKRVPPLKKMKKRRKTIQENDELKGLRVYTPSMSSSSSVINGEENFKVMVETKDDSTFKLNESSTQRTNFGEESDVKNMNEENLGLDQKQSDSKSEELVSKQYLETDENTSKIELTKEGVIESKMSEDEKFSRDIQQLPEDLIKFDNDLKTQTIERKDSDSKSVGSIDSQKKDMSNKSVITSESEHKGRDSQKSTQESSRTKRSVSRRRSSVVDINNTKPIEKKIEVKQKSDNKKTNESQKEQKGDKKVDPSKKSSTRSNSRKRSEEISKDLAENNEKKAKDISKAKSRKEFSDKLEKINKKSIESDKSDLKSNEKSVLSANSERDGKKISKEDKEMDDNRDIDSITYVKSDNESLKSNISSGNEKIETKSEDSLQNVAELKEQDSNEMKADGVPFDKSSKKDNNEDKGEYEEYYDQWESDSENTIIDSQIGQKSTEDINNNSVEESDRQMSKESNDTIDKSSVKSENKSMDITDGISMNKIDVKSEVKSAIKSEGKTGVKLEDKSVDKLEDKSVDKSEDKSVVKSEDKSVVKSEDKSVVKSEDKSMVKSEDKSVVKSEDKSMVKSEDKPMVKSEDKSEVKTHDKLKKKTEIKGGIIGEKENPNTKNDTHSSSGKIGGKVSEKKPVKSRIDSKSDKRKAGSGESGKSVENKSIKTKDNKIAENRGLTSDKTKIQTDRRPSISSQKSNVSKNLNNNNKKIERKPSVVSKTKPKADKKVETIIKSSDPLESKSFLSTSDMSLNKSPENQNILKLSPLKNSISNQDINDYHDTIEDRPLTNFSSEESIFDSSLVMADIERNDLQMYSDIDRICQNGETESPLEHIQRNSNSPNREVDGCPEFCNNVHKSESRCCHKLHFKTLPAHLGKVEVAHIGSRVDSRRDTTYPDNTRNVSRDRVRRVRRVRPTSDGYKSIDPNLITQTVEKSLRKYQLERKLFEELHELKRFQIRSGKSNEILMVKRLVDKFRRDVKAPGMTDFNGNYTYKNYEFYLYDQLRRLSTSNEGKVSLLTRSASHENIQIIRNSNENITQSSPELMLNSEGLDTNQQTISKSHEIHTIDNQYSSQNTIHLIKAINETTEEVVVNVVDKETALHSTQSESSDQTEHKDVGNHRDSLKHFDNEFEVDVTNSEQKNLELSNCDQKVTVLTKNDTHYQNSDLMISENFCITQEVSHIVIDSKEQPNHRSDQSSQISESQSNSTKISEKDEQNSISSENIDQKEGSVAEPKQSLVAKIEEISEIHSNTILNEALTEQTRRLSVIESNFETQIKTQKTSKQITSFESNESQVTDQISDAKSTYGSTKSAKIQSGSQYSGSSRRMSSKSFKSANNTNADKRRVKERQTFKKECLKPVVDIEPSERAKNRKKFKRLKTSIPPKLEINISSKEIRNRWKDIKETEMKKVFILSSHKQNELISGFTLWFELNKNFRENKSIDLQIDRYIIENRSGLQRTHSDSYLNRYKLDSNSISFDKSIK